MIRTRLVLIRRLRKVGKVFDTSDKVLLSDGMNTSFEERVEKKLCPTPYLTVASCPCNTYYLTFILY
jgi:hypothetical protein